MRNMFPSVFQGAEFIFDVKIGNFPDRFPLNTILLSGNQEKAFR